MSPSASTPLSDVEALMWSLPSPLQPTMTAIARFRERITARQARDRFAQATETVPRLRERVAAGPTGLLGRVRPRWIADADFRLAHHLRVVDLGGSGDLATVERMAATTAHQPFDRSRSPWGATLVQGLAGDHSALILRAHHALTDGLGGVAILLEFMELDPGTDLGASRSGTAGSARGSGTAPPPARTDSDPSIEDRAHALGRLLGSVARGIAPDRAPDHLAPTPGHPAFRSIEADLPALRAVGKRAGGTVNDALLAAVVIAVVSHRQRASASTGRPVTVSIPVSTRRMGDDLTNRVVPIPVRFDEPDDLGRLDPVAMITDIGRRVRSARVGADDRAAGFLAAAGRILPSSVAATMARSAAASIDLTVSNIPGPAGRLLLGGSPVEALIPFGPLVGTHLNITMASHAGTAQIGMVVDPARHDPDQLVEELRIGLDAVTAR